VCVCVCVCVCVSDTEEASCKQHVPVMVYCHFDLLACRF